MHILKSILLGSAAGLLAVAGAQAADLPVKAKPVQYVKVCSLYGAGFWYVPGTDTCLKIGSYIRTQANYNGRGNGVPDGADDGANGGRNTRTDQSQFAFRSRQAISVDLRTQTEYGTLRSYLQLGAEVTTSTSASAGSTAGASDAIFVNRGFVQFAGFTVGRIRSMFDINTMSTYSYINSKISGDTGSTGTFGWAYTAQFGNGVSATLSFEDPGASSRGRGRVTVDATAIPFATNANNQAVTTDNRGVTYPDAVGVLRIDQAWGYAQVAGALHDVAGGYYGATNLTGNGHPSDKIGWAVTGGFTLNDAFGLKGDAVGLQVAYAKGASGYALGGVGMWGIYNGSGSAGFGFVSDGVFGASPSSIELTEAWGFTAFYQHRWNQKWRTSVYGGYNAVDYNATATATLCAAGFGGMTGISNCNPDFSNSQIGTRTQWNPHPDLLIGLDVQWNRLHSAFKGTATLAAAGAQPAGVRTIEDQDIFTFAFRVQRNFLP